LQIECIGCVSAILPDLFACHPLNTKSRALAFRSTREADA
jgi:hypothetical protein